MQARAEAAERTNAVLRKQLNQVQARTVSREGFEAIRAATEGFSDHNLLQHGGQASVWRGQWRGRPVAIKQVAAESLKVFKQEVSGWTPVAH